MRKIKTIIIAILTLIGLIPAANPADQNVTVQEKGKVNVFLSVDDSDSKTVTVCENSAGGYKGKITIGIDPLNFKIPGISLRFAFDKTKVSIDSVFFSSPFDAGVWNEDKANEEGILEVTGLSLQRQLPNAPFSLAEIQYSLLEGTGELQMLDDYQVVFEEEGDTDQSDNILAINQPDLVRMEMTADEDCVQ